MSQIRVGAGSLIFIRIIQLPDSKTMTVQLIGKDDSSFDDSEVLTGRWQSYIDSFVSVCSRYFIGIESRLTFHLYQNETTEGVPATRVKLPFLRK